MSDQATDHVPTVEAYGDFQRAYQCLNMALFGGALPDVMFTLARTRHANGYVVPEGFTPMADSSQTHTHIAEIGLNPETFAHRTAEQVLSTIAHEMCHLAQYLDGKASPNGYHNRDFSERMLAIGLQTSDTGKPGGLPIGQRMTHYIIDGGAFQTEARRLIEQEGWTLRYTSPVLSDDDRARKAARKASKTKYTCPVCQSNAWARPGARLMCDDYSHNQPHRMAAQD